MRAAVFPLSPLTKVSKLRLIANAVLLSIFISAGVVALGLNPLAGYMPLFVAASGGLFAALGLITDLVRAARLGTALDTSIVQDDNGKAVVDLEPEATEEERLRISVRYLLWCAAALSAFWFLGMFVGCLLFLISFLTLEGRMSKRATSTAVVAVFIVLYIFSQVFPVNWPTFPGLIL